MKSAKRITNVFTILSQISVYQIVTKAGIFVWIYVLRNLFRLLLKSTGRVALTSGDFVFLFTTWQGPLILAIGLISLFIYVALDLNTKVILCGRLLKGQADPVWQNLKEGFLSMRKFISLRGLWIIIYISLIVPLVGVGFSISLTSNFYIPAFITDVINKSPVYAPLYYSGMVFFTIFGIANIFILHGVLLDDMPLKEAGRQSKELMKAHWKDYFLSTLKYFAKLSLYFFIGFILINIIPMIVIQIIAGAGMIGRDTYRFLMILITLIGVVLTGWFTLITTPLYLLEVTRRYYTYKSGEPVGYPENVKKVRMLPHLLAGAAGTVGIVLAAMFLTVAFDAVFPPKVTTKVVAHRAGGVEAPENTLAGLEASAKAGAFGAEIDIQRTSDGYYVVNHDSTFKRVAGVNKEPSAMTLDEVKQLRVDGEPVATFEEMLEGCKGRLVLFTELKGSTADIRMTEDAVRIIKEHGMEDETVIISLKYNLIDYIETNWPEIQTGYLAFASFGNTASLNCDYLALEEEIATPENISSIHENGKKIMIWTINSRDSQKRFLNSRVDAIITDQVFQAEEVIRDLDSRTDFDKLQDAMFDWIQ